MLVLEYLARLVGVWVGGKISKADTAIQKYLGIALFPQAGIAIGLALSLQNEVGFEIIAPIVLKCHNSHNDDSRNDRTIFTKFCPLWRT